MFCQNEVVEVFPESRSRRSRPSLAQQGDGRWRRVRDELVSRWWVPQRCRGGGPSHYYLNPWKPSDNGDYRATICRLPQGAADSGLLQRSSEV